MTTEFEMTLEREDGNIEISVSADGEIDHRDPSVGIFYDGIAYVNFTATDEDGNNVTLTACEDREVEIQAHEKLCGELTCL